MMLKFCATDFTKLTSPALPSFPAHLYAFQFHELTSFFRQYDVFSFCVRREYSASMTQKRGLD